MDSTLVIGFGPGLGLEVLLGRTNGNVLGVDPSNVMHRAASRRNAAALKNGRLRLVVATVDTLADDVGRFDGAIAVHTLQMCQPFPATAKRLATLLNPGARLVSITHEWAARRDYGSSEAFCETIESGLLEVGFQDIFIGRAEAERRTAILIEAQRSYASP